jgi:hypothetical protein
MVCVNPPLYREWFSTSALKNTNNEKHSNGQTYWIKKAVRKIQWLRLELRNEVKLWLRMQPKKQGDKDGNNETSFRSMTKMATKDTQKWTATKKWWHVRFRAIKIATMIC